MYKEGCVLSAFFEDHKIFDWLDGNQSQYINTQVKPIINSFKMSNLGFSQDGQLRILKCCLQKLKAIETDQNERTNIETIALRLAKSNNKAEILLLGQRHTEILKALLQVFQGICKGFEEVRNTEDYSSFIRSDFSIVNYLLEAQVNLPIILTKTDRDSVFTQYFVYLTANFKKTLEGIPNKFITEWSKQAKEKIKQIQKQNNKDNTDPGISKPEMKKKAQLIQPSSSSSFSSYSSSSQSEEYEKSDESLLQPKKQEMRRMKIEKKKQLQLQRQRQIERVNQRRQRAARQRVKFNLQEQMKRKNELQRRSDHKQQTRINKGRIVIIQKYLQSRKDLHFYKYKTKDKSKELAEYLTLKLDLFIKHTVEKLYNIACLKNNQSSNFCSQIDYFARENGRAQSFTEFYFEPQTKIYNLSYKQNYQIYCDLRLKELKKEDQLRNTLQAKINEGNIRMDKKVQNYILVSKTKEKQSFLLPYRQEKETLVLPSKSVAIRLQHIIFFLSNHKWLKNSPLLINVYNHF